MFPPRRLPNGNLVIPVTATDSSGSVVGDAAAVEIDDSDPRWDRWDEYARSQGI